MTPNCEFMGCKLEAQYIIMTREGKYPMNLCFHHALELAEDNNAKLDIIGKPVPKLDIAPNLESKLRKLHDAIYGRSTESNWQKCRTFWAKDGQWLAKYNP